HGIMKSSTPLTSTTSTLTSTTSTLIPTTSTLPTTSNFTSTASTLTSTTSTINFSNSESEINIPLIKFIVSSGLPFNFVDTLKSAGFVNPNIELSTSDIIKKQINKAYNRLFLQLKLKAQQEKSTMLSIYEFKPDTKIDEDYAVITCNWLTKDFEFHKIQLFTKKCYSEIDDEEDFYGDIIDALLELELTNLKFYSDNVNDFFDRVRDWDADEKYQNFVQNLTRLPVNCLNKLNGLILRSLGKWAREHVNNQTMPERIKAVENATKCLWSVVNFLKHNRVQGEIQNMQITFSYSTTVDVQNAKKISCNCTYHQIAFLKLMEEPFIQLVNNYNNYESAYIKEKGKFFKGLLLDSLPFGIFSKLLQLFKPLEHITCGTRKVLMKEYSNLIDRIVINADNILKELQFNGDLFNGDLEYELFKSFLTSIPLCFGDSFLFDVRLASLLDPSSKTDEVSPVIIEYTLKKCQAYYLNNIFSDNLDKSLQAANEELRCYINRPQLLLDTINPYEWWQGSKQMLPGLATLAREYLPTLTVDDENPVENLDELINTYDDDDMTYILFIMSGYKRNQEIFQPSNSNDNENNLIAISSSGAQQTKRQRTENNDKESICWKYFEPFKVPKENGTVTKCTIPGCTT
ncbi:16132_t:CDS:2, partial [Racocetra fulgida]